MTAPPGLPVTGSTRLNVVAAAFWSPGLGPSIPCRPLNWARAYVVATVVSSLTRTRLVVRARTAPPSPTATTERSRSLPAPEGVASTYSTPAAGRV
ncbi:hypothetical protein FRZ03_09245 [Streptomyces misionensis]|uniref:Uncharacterized protein n=1 Tax=Streptomyces misionensis TaxID=67331 RepID=A0A5C6K038_9ACTN|nr:hypothetical protein FRZ03_09245 [Streptomyces misionensis]